MKVLLLLLFTLSSQAALASADSLPRKLKEYSLLVYYAGDNNLSEFMKSSVKRLIREGSGDNVHVVAQYDGSKEKDSFRVSIESTKKEDVYQTTTFEKNIEYDMGNPQTLADFVSWGRENFPAKKTILVVHAHGRGPINLPIDDGQKFGGNSDRVSLASGSDEGSDSYMNEEDLVQKLKKVLGPQKLDLFVYDSCLMGSLEVMAMISDVAKYAVASPHTIFVKAADDLVQDEARAILIEKIAKYIKANLQSTEVDIGREIVAEFRRSYENYRFASAAEVDIDLNQPQNTNRLPATLAFYDLKEARNAAAEFSVVTENFRSLLQRNPEVLVPFYRDIITSDYIDTLGYIDVLTLTHAIAKTGVDVSRFVAAVRKMVVVNTLLFVNSEKPMAGLSFYFPQVNSEIEFVQRFAPFYKNLNTARLYKWDLLITDFWTANLKDYNPFWLGLLNDWESGIDTRVVPSKDLDYNEYHLFIALDIVVLRLKLANDFTSLASHVQRIAKIKRASQYLEKHRQFTHSLMPINN